MSYGIMPFTVQLALVERAFGSQDAALVSAIADEFADLFEQDRFDADDEDELTLELALHEIVEGKPLREGYGSKYGYVLKMLCWHLGKHLPNAHFSSMDSDWADEVDRGLSRAGVPPETLALSWHLIYRGSPVAIPEPDDFPAIGYLRAVEVTPALRALESANLAALEPEVREAVRELIGWLEECSRSACDLVCFYH